MDDHEHSIRQRAYEIWESEGRPAGREAHHWEQARAELAEIRKESAGSPEPKTPKKRAAPKTAAKTAADSKPAAKSATEKLAAKGKASGKAGKAAPAKAAPVDRDLAVLGKEPASRRKPAKS